MQEKVDDKEQPQLEPHLSVVLNGFGGSSGVDVDGRRSSSSQMSLEFNLESKMGVENL